ncbi:hypothetical protein C8Q77DRAFT_1160808 [Trametes polyzona]|nr:hypothetical protein C8Q77DRAFT_1160808 [Trametes polyzona]
MPVFFVPKSREEGPDGRLSMGVILSIVFCVIFFIIVIVVFCMFARSKCCFRRKSVRSTVQQTSLVQGRGGVTYPSASAGKWQGLRRFKASQNGRAARTDLELRESPSPTPTTPPQRARSVSSLSGASDAQHLLPTVAVPPGARVSQSRRNPGWRAS